MILQALYEYYQRKAADPESGIPPLGLDWVRVPFLIVIAEDGTFVGIEDTRSDGKTPRKFLFPKPAPRSGSKSYATTHLLWDHIGYVSGTAIADTEKAKTIAEHQHQTWLHSIESLPDNLSNLRAVCALRAFYRNRQLERLVQDPTWEQCLRIPGCVMAFKLDGATAPIAGLPEVLEHAQSDRGSEDGPIISGRCLVTGQVEPIARTHSTTPINKDSKYLVSFQKGAGYESFGKTQGAIAPVGRSVEFAYTTALNTLLRSENRVQVGDATAVFWGETSSKFEDCFSLFFQGPRKDDPDGDANAVRYLYESLRTGALDLSSDSRFYVLGLSPSSVRISIRFWQIGTVRDFAVRLRQHFDDLEIVRRPGDPGRYSLFWLLTALVRDSSPKNLDTLPPNLAGDVVRSVLGGGPYPAMLLQHVIRRIRAEQSRSGPGEQNVTPTRAAIIKAYLNRFHRTHTTSEKEITVSLDQENENIGYRLGRLFAVLEKIQEDANPGLNATIRDRYYGAASANPTTAFPQLLKLKNHHLKKLGDKPAWVGAHEKRLTEIFGGIPTSLPHHLRMEDQARFAIGYYHQRQAFYTKGDNGNGGTPSPESQEQENS